MSEYVDALQVTILREWMDHCLGKKLGGGIGRMVFIYELNPAYVVKVEDKSGHQNVLEWEIWQVVAETPYQRWFAPCKLLSAYGSVLVQARTLPAPRARYPKKMPEFLGDYKYSNYGLYRGRLVCHDYGSAIVLSNGISERMRKADWWDSDDGASFDDTKEAL